MEISGERRKTRKIENHIILIIPFSIIFIHIYSVCWCWCGCCVCVCAVWRFAGGKYFCCCCCFYPLADLSGCRCFFSLPFGAHITWICACHAIHKKQRMCQPHIFSTNSKNLEIRLKKWKFFKNTSTLIAYYCLVFAATAAALPLSSESDGSACLSQCNNVQHMVYILCMENLWDSSGSWYQIFVRMYSMNDLY